ncbi:hypothetical protein [Halalkalicoccus tibetensis]|uniref:50S ribosomal protein L29 n=1 Tax=Halalkalicoccus tibetensis TaxID=175632 RepID=A0ABD5VE84_9EURY
MSSDDDRGAPRSRDEIREKLRELKAEKSAHTDLLDRRKPCATLAFHERRCAQGKVAAQVLESAL